MEAGYGHVAQFVQLKDVADGGLLSIHGQSEGARGWMVVTAGTSLAPESVALKATSPAARVVLLVGAGGCGAQERSGRFLGERR